MLISVERIVEKYLNEEIVDVKGDTVVLENREVFEKELLEETMDAIKTIISTCLEENKLRKSSMILNDLMRVYDYYEYEWMA